jgi:hypothetical protein
MIDLTIVVSSLPLVFKTQVGTSDDGVYNFEGWETGGLLGGFLIVRWRWRWVVQLCLLLGYLQRCQRVSDCLVGCVDLACVRCVIV